MELCDKRQDPFRFFLFFSEGLFSFPISHFGEGIFHKVLWVSSLDQAFFKIVFFPLNKALEELVLRSLSASPLTKPPFVAIG